MKRIESFFESTLPKIILTVFFVPFFSIYLLVFSIPSGLVKIYNHLEDKKIKKDLDKTSKLPDPTLSLTLED